jgi:hypothetical protein
MADGPIPQLSMFNPQPSGITFHAYEDSSPADENERQALKLRVERALGHEQGGYWRVDIIPGRYRWYVRPVRLRTRTKVERRR